MMNEKNYIVDMLNNLDADEEDMLIAVVKKTAPITTDEVIARAYDWLDEKDFMGFMEWWKANNFQPLVYAELDDDCDYFIVARKDNDDIVIVRWER